MMTHTQAIYKAQIVFEEALSDKETIDQLLHIDAQMYANTGSDTSKAEMESVKRASAFIHIDSYWMQTRCGSSSLLGEHQ